MSRDDHGRRPLSAVAAPVAAVGLLVLVALGARGTRPPAVQDTATAFPWAAVLVPVGVLALLVVVVLLRPGRRPGRRGRRDVVGVLRIIGVLLLVMWLAPRLAPLAEQVAQTAEAGDEAPADDAAPPTDGDDGGALVPTMVGVATLALLVAGVALRRRRGTPTAPAAPTPTAGAPAPPRPDPRDVTDPRGAVLAAYAEARRLVADEDDPAGPLALARRLGDQPTGHAFRELTRLYLPVRFGTAEADESRRRAALEALDRLRLLVPS